jgi:hypothetical protein
MTKFLLIAGALLALAAGGGFFLGWGEGRNKFANECITVGNFTVWDHGHDRRRRFACKEAQADTHSESEAKIIL